MIKVFKIGWREKGVASSWRHWRSSLTLLVSILHKTSKCTPTPTVQVIHDFEDSTTIMHVGTTDHHHGTPIAYTSQVGIWQCSILLFIYALIFTEENLNFKLYIYIVCTQKRMYIRCLLCCFARNFVLIGTMPPLSHVYIGCLAFLDDLILYQYIQYLE